MSNLTVTAIGLTEYQHLSIIASILSCIRHQTGEGGRLLQFSFAFIMLRNELHQATHCITEGLYHISNCLKLQWNWTSQLLSKKQISKQLHGLRHTAFTIPHGGSWQPYPNPWHAAKILSQLS